MCSSRGRLARGGSIRAHGSTRCWLCHSRVFRVERQRLCPSLGHRGVAHKQKTVSGVVSGLLPPAQRRTLPAQPGAQPPPGRDLPGSVGLCWIHTPPGGKVHPQEASSSPGGPFRASPEMQLQREQKGSNPTLQLSRLQSPVVPCPPLTGTQHCPWGLFTPFQQSSSRSWCSNEVLTPPEVHPPCNVCQGSRRTGEFCTAAGATSICSSAPCRNVPSTGG